MAVLIADIPEGVPVFTADGQELGFVREFVEDRFLVVHEDGSHAWLWAADTDAIAAGRLAMAFESTELSDHLAPAPGELPLRPQDQRGDRQR